MKKTPDAAARLADWAFGPVVWPELNRLCRRRIRSLIRREVRKERERCVAICRAEFDTARYRDNELYVGWRGAASAIQIKIAKGPK